VKYLALAAPLLLAAVLLAAEPAGTAKQPRIIYSKSFPGSTPAFFQITVDKSGAAEYKEDPKDEDPLKFQLTEAEASAMFALADKLDHFSRPLESGLKVANMGTKTLRFEGDGQPHETKFNYSEDLDAKSLADWFERIAESERAYIDLERSVRFDKLGVQDSILRIEILRDQKRLMAEKQFLPMLDRVANNESYMHMARSRAAALAESMRAVK
jgi:hypothetical protein